MKKLTLFFLVFLISSQAVAAVGQPSFTVDGLTANYYLDRNSDGISTLVAEETFNIIFPSSGTSFSGFTRAIPTQYLKNSNDLQVTSVTDITGKSVKYGLSKDADQNLVVNVGDPAITVFGSQTYMIRYQAKGVINFLSDHQEFYPNFNGRGWDVPFNNVGAVIHLTPNLASSLNGKPKCLIDAGNCKVEENKNASETTYIITALNRLAAHQSLTAKLSFKAGTFKPYAQSKWLKWLEFVGVVLALLLISALIRQSRQSLKKRKNKK